MKNKFFILGITSLLAALLMVSGALADSNTTSVTVAADTTLTLSLGSKITSMTFTVSSYVVNDSHSKAWYDGTTATTAYAINVIDYTGAAASGKTGHYVTLNFNRSRWFYNATDTDKATRLRYSTLVSTNSVTSNQMRLFIKGLTGTYTFTTKDSSLCNPSQATYSAAKSLIPSGSPGIIAYYGASVTRASQTLVSTTTSCPGTSKYYLKSATVVGPSNGFGNGAYTLAGTITLGDGE